jgi:uncharacterized protein YbjT (DUF2867 family)
MAGTVLVVGATGQLGTAVVRRLAAAGRPVRALVRPASASRRPGGPGVEIALGDLREPPTLDAACRGIGTVVATANAVVPRGPASFRETEERGYANLIGACRRAGVRRFVFMSVPVTPEDEKVETFRLKRQIEVALAGAGFELAVFQGSLFMDDWFALMGSSIPLRGSEAHTLQRPFWFPRVFLGAVGHSIERRGIALVPGDGATGHAFIALDDVADFLAAAAMAPSAAGTFEIGGPEILTWNEIVALFAKTLGRRIRAIRTPAASYRVLSALLAPFSEAAANLMAMSALVAEHGTPWDSRPVASRFGVSLTSAEDFLRRRAGLPE